MRPPPLAALEVEDIWSRHGAIQRTSVCVCVICLHTCVACWRALGASIFSLVILNGPVACNQNILMITHDVMAGWLGLFSPNKDWLVL